MDFLTHEEIRKLTPAEAQRYSELLTVQLAKRSPLDLAEIMFPETRRWAHLELLNEYLLALAEYRLTAKGPVQADEVRWYYDDYDGIRHEAARPQDIPEEVNAYGAVAVGEPIVFRLAVSMRPRAGKSRLVNEVFPHWLHLHDPDLQIGVATYSDTFAWDWGGEARDRALDLGQREQDPLPWFPQPAGGVRAPREVFQVEGAKGKIRYAGTGGAITGKTLQVLIADDLVKNDDQAQSEAQRAELFRFYDSTWTSRKTADRRPGAKFPIPIEVLMGTRWHELDPVGYATYDPETKQQREGWCVLNVPAVSEGDGDPLGRPEGATHPNAAGENREHMEAIKRDNPRMYSALYQGRPAPVGKGLISSNFQGFWRGEEGALLYNVDGETMTCYETDLVHFASADMAATKKTTSDWTVLYHLAWDRVNGIGFVLDEYREKITTDEYMDEIPPWLEARKLRIVLVENVTYGQTLGQGLEKRGFQVEYPKLSSDKIGRALASTLGAMVARGAWRTPLDASWRDDLASEVGLFPYGAHDDRVDAMVFGSDYARELPEAPPRVEKEPKTVPEMLDAHVEQQARRRSGRQGGRFRAGGWTGLRR